MLRLTIEPQLKSPSLVAVTSAALDDGTDFVAMGLAKACALEGYRCRLVRLERRGADSIAPALDGHSATAADRVSSADRAHDFDEIAIDLQAYEQRSLSRAIGQIATESRAAFDMTIIDAGALDDNSFALLAARLADGVLLAVRGGRPERAADREIAPALLRVSARVLGIVQTPRDVRHHTAAARASRVSVARRPVEPASIGEPVGARLQIEVGSGTP